ncbi:S1C family serine protease [Patescibacteria group bacterium]|nr:S1C family serine protease [Patescibacteria group bacterium]MBU4512216.1 S1C family serine protease [Patescibacteria group bacterium]MCG2692634.1 S1C family serine protease [Candidatus Parcubacteria bacterium]
MKKVLPKNLASLLLTILILFLIIQNPLPIAKVLYKLAPIARAEEIIRYFEEEAIMDAVETVNKSVVEIIVSQETKTENLTISQEKGKATGIIISKEGLILTNKHVLNKGNAYKIIVNDKTVFGAEIDVKSPINDLALLKIDAKGLMPAKLGDSKALKLGQTVLAIGYAKGEFSKTVTRGVVSGLTRAFVAGDNGKWEQLTDLIQTDAMINNGSSGGPLINIKGEVIGITTAMDESARAINFALPIHRAKPMIEFYQKTGRYEPAWLGVYYVPVNDELKNQLNLPYNYGAYLTNDEDNKYNGILPNSPAESAGLQKDDLILEINGIKIDENNPLADIIQKYQANTLISLRIYRNGIQLSKNVTLGKWPEELDPLKP